MPVKKMSLTAKSMAGSLSRLQKANTQFTAIYPGESSQRQAIHTVYGGAHLFKADSARKLGDLALISLQEYAPNFAILSRALGLRGSETLPESLDQIAALEVQLKKNADYVRRSNEAAWFAYTVYTRVFDKLKREPVEDFRIDFEDGYGNRPDAEEDGHAEQAAAEVANGMKAGSLPPFIGIRIKPFSEELAERSIRTLDIFVTTLVEKAKCRLPDNFVVTIPKVTIPEQVTTLTELLGIIEARTGLAPGSLKLEIMVETPQSIIDRHGQMILPLLVAAADGRCIAAHFGTYDYTAGCNITAAYQQMTHPACDFAKHVMQVSLAGTGIMLSDGATNVMPVGPHRAAKGGPLLSSAQIEENRRVVHRAWKLHFDHVQHSLTHAYYQGWDLHPAQLPTRYAAVYSFFLDGLEAASLRLKTFIEKAAQATLVGDVFDDAATGQGLLNYFLRGLNCGAITEEEAQATGLTLKELRGRSFIKILDARRT